MTGFVNVNKAVGDSSAKEVAVIKRLTGLACGHLGTLDPMAEGVLPVAVGNATRLFDYFLSKNKTYIATFTFGKDYDTLDTTGTVVADGGGIPTAEEVKGVINGLTGSVMQVPPRYSAKNVNGRRGYELARKGIDFELPAKQVEIRSIELLSPVNKNAFSFKIECGSGTYIRSIARDMAKALNTYAAMSALVRIASGPFNIENSVKTSELTKENICRYIIPCDELLPFDTIKTDSKTAKKVFNGVAVECDCIDGTYKIYKENGEFYGLASVENGVLRVRTKLC